MGCWRVMTSCWRKTVPRFLSCSQRPRFIQDIRIPRVRRPHRRYYRMVFAVYPRKDNQSLNVSHMRKLRLYVSKNTDKVPKIGRLVLKRIRRHHRRKRDNLVRIGLLIFQELITSCQEQVTLFANSALQAVDLLLEDAPHTVQASALETLLKLLTSGRDLSSAGAVLSSIHTNLQIIALRGSFTKIDELGLNRLAVDCIGKLAPLADSSTQSVVVILEGLMKAYSTCSMLGACNGTDLFHKPSHRQESGQSTTDAYDPQRYKQDLRHLLPEAHMKLGSLAAEVSKETRDPFRAVSGNPTADGSDHERLSPLVVNTASPREERIVSAEEDGTISALHELASALLNSLAAIVSAASIVETGALATTCIKFCDSHNLWKQPRFPIADVFRTIISCCNLPLKPDVLLRLFHHSRDGRSPLFKAAVIITGSRAVEGGFATTSIGSPAVPIFFSILLPELLNAVQKREELHAHWKRTFGAGSDINRRSSWTSASSTAVDVSDVEGVLSDDDASAISSSRDSKGWDKKDLRRMLKRWVRLENCIVDDALLQLVRAGHDTPQNLNMLQNGFFLLFSSASGEWSAEQRHAVLRSMYQVLTSSLISSFGERLPSKAMLPIVHESIVGSTFARQWCNKMLEYLIVGASGTATTTSRRRPLLKHSTEPAATGELNSPRSPRLHESRTIGGDGQGKSNDEGDFRRSVMIFSAVRKHYAELIHYAIYSQLINQHEETICLHSTWNLMISCLTNFSSKILPFSLPMLHRAQLELSKPKSIDTPKGRAYLRCYLSVVLGYLMSVAHVLRVESIATYANEKSAALSEEDFLSHSVSCRKPMDMLLLSGGHHELDHGDFSSAFNMERHGIDFESIVSMINKTESSHANTEAKSTDQEIALSFDPTEIESSVLDCISSFMDAKRTRSKVNDGDDGPSDSVDSKSDAKSSVVAAVPTDSRNDAASFPGDESEMAPASNGSGRSRSASSVLNSFHQGRTSRVMSTRDLPSLDKISVSQNGSLSVLKELDDILQPYVRSSSTASTADEGEPVTSLLQVRPPDQNMC